jgi:histidine triad (HIT) family protein
VRSSGRIDLDDADSRARDACPLCRVARADDHPRLIERARDVVAVLDVAPINPGHLLIVPADHIPALAYLPATTGAQMFHLAKRCAAALRASALRCAGVSLLMNDGSAASRAIDHVHLHVVPRSRGDGFVVAAQGTPATREDLRSVAKLIRDALPKR